MRKIISLLVLILSASVARDAQSYTIKKKKVVNKAVTVVSTTPVVKTAVVLVKEPKRKKQAPAKKDEVKDTPEMACRKIKDRKLRRECLTDAR
jgi:hypothetical protein